MENTVCYRFQCENYLICKKAAGLSCCLEKDPEERVIPDGSCTAENGYPHFAEKPLDDRRYNPWFRSIPGQ